MYYPATYCAYANTALRQEMIEMLRQQRSECGPRRRPTPAGSAMVPDNLCTYQRRPGDIEEQLAPGHGEDDFIKGAFNHSPPLGCAQMAA